MLIPTSLPKYEQLRVGIYPHVHIVTQFDRMLEFNVGSHSKIAQVSSNRLYLGVVSGVG